MHARLLCAVAIAAFAQTITTAHAETEGSSEDQPPDAGVAPQDAPGPPNAIGSAPVVPATAQPVTSPAPRDVVSGTATTVVPPKPYTCKHALYAQPTLLLGSSTGGVVMQLGTVILRAAGGLQVCIAPGLAIYGGIDIESNSNGGGTTGYSGYGFEIGARGYLGRIPDHGLVRVGPRFGYVTYDNTHKRAYWVGARLDVGRAVLGIDVVHASYDRYPGTANGVYASIGLGGWPGAIATVVATGVIYGFACAAKCGD